MLWDLQVTAPSGNNAWEAREICSTGTAWYYVQAFRVKVSILICRRGRIHESLYITCFKVRLKLTLMSHTHKFLTQVIQITTNSFVYQYCLWQKISGTQNTYLMYAYIIIYGKCPQYTAFITLKRKIPKEKKWKMIYWWDNLLHLRNSGWLEKILKWWFTDTEKTPEKSCSHKMKYLKLLAQAKPQNLMGN